MKSIHNLLLALVGITLLPLAAHAGSSRVAIVCDLERETDTLIEEIRDARNAYARAHRCHNHDNPYNRIYSAYKNVEEDVDTLHYRVRKNRSKHSQADAFEDVMSAYREAQARHRTIPRDGGHMNGHLRNIDRLIHSLCGEFAHSSHTGSRRPTLKTINSHHGHDQHGHGQNSHYRSLSTTRSIHNPQVRKQIVRAMRAFR